MEAEELTPEQVNNMDDFKKIKTKTGLCHLFVIEKLSKPNSFKNLSPSSLLVY